MGYTDTENYKFKKPDESNNFDVMDLNNALDAADKVIHDNDVNIHNVVTETDTAIRTELGARIDGIDTRINSVSARAEEANRKIDSVVIKTTWE